jgi:CheY-like chemotaxis protein
MALERVLVVEDDQEQAKALSDAFHRYIGGDMPSEEIAPWVTSPEEASKRLLNERFSAVLLDMAFAKCRDEGLRVLRFLKLAGLASPGTPVIVLTAIHDIGTCVRAMQAGAADYIMKGGTEMRDVDEPTIDAALRACTNAVARATGTAQEVTDEWLRLNREELLTKFNGNLLAVFPPGHGLTDVETVGGRDFLAFSDHEEAVSTFLAHLEWLDKEPQFAFAPRCD